MTPATTLVHEAGPRIRLRIASDVDAIDLRLRVQQLPGVESVRLNAAARSLVVSHDGRQATREALLQESARRPATIAVAPARRRPARLPVSASVAGAALAAALPQPGRSVVALALVAGKSALGLRAGSEPTAVVLDAISLATTALTGHPLTSTTSVVLSSVAEQWRDRLLSDTDQLLAHLVPADDVAYEVIRGGRRRRLAATAIVPGDRIELAAEQTVPVDGVVEPDGQGEGFVRLHAGDRVERGTRLLAEKDAAHSRSARLRSHIRHAVMTRDQPGPLTPDMERLLAVPVAAGGLVLALTKDTARTASMLQADPQQAVALAHPVAREGAIYAAARHGALMSSLDAIERLAVATAVAFQDVGVLTDSYWYVGPIEVFDGAVSAEQVRGWLARSIGTRDPQRLQAGIPDVVVDGWLDHGAVVADGKAVIHIAGSRVLERTWNLALTEAERHSLARFIGIVQDGRVLARVELESRLRPGIREHFGRLRQLGVRRIAVFTENPYEATAQRLSELGADIVLAGRREQQAAWLDKETEAGRRTALVHTSMRDLLPPGGLSLCPVDAEAGAHGVLLGEPLSSLASARAVAHELRGAIRRHFGSSMVLNAGLMVASALATVPPIAVALARHGFSALLLAQSARLARRTAAPPIQEREKSNGTV
jgi:manganese/zinc-transporting P-type ATPase C